MTGGASEDAVSDALAVDAPGPVAADDAEADSLAGGAVPGATDCWPGPAAAGASPTAAARSSAPAPGPAPGGGQVERAGARACSRGAGGGEQSIDGLLRREAEAAQHRHRTRHVRSG